MRNTEKDSTFEDIYVHYYARLKRFAQEYVVSEEDAENILQDVFLDFWEKREVLLSHVNVIAFLFTSIKNRCIDFLRRKMLEQEVTNLIQEEYLLTLQMNLNSLQTFNEHIFTQEEIEELINKAIASLPDKCREIFIKNKIEGKRRKDIAAELNISVNTIETQMTIAYKKLKEDLKDIYPLFLFLLYW
ncbi:MAG: RNA polymerase sigma-70 factor [Tannerella sp.]|nr:RNA polymerase sigma-70 factor [Tannerella sp.]